MVALVRGDVERKKIFYRKRIRVSGQNYKIVMIFPKSVHSFECKAFLISKKLPRSPLNSTMADLHFVCVCVGVFLLWYCCG